MDSCGVHQHMSTTTNNMADNTHMRIREDKWTVKQIAESYVNPNGTENIRGDIYVPLSQREWAWKHSRGEIKKQKLIDSVMNGFPIPTCIVNKVDKFRYEVHDGRHRMESLQLYYTDKFRWNSKLFSELSADEKARFEYREIPITIMLEATPVQLADAFIRLNSGSPLKDYDYFWAHRNRPFMQSVLTLICNNERLSRALGGLNLHTRGDLSNWAAVMAGLATKNGGNITTSYLRVSTEVGLDAVVDTAYATAGIEAVCILLEGANREFPASDKDKRSLKKVGKIIAYFLSDWIAGTSPTIHDKWVRVIGKLRSSDDEVRQGMSLALTTSGAQNLTTTKIEKVLNQVNRYLDTGLNAAGSVQSYSDTDE